MRKTIQLFLSVCVVFLTSFTTQQIILASESNDYIVNDIPTFETEKEKVVPKNDLEKDDNLVYELEDNLSTTIVEDSELNSLDSITLSDIENKETDLLEEVVDPERKIIAEKKTSKIENNHNVSQSYESAIILGQYSIDTKPWGEKGYQSVGKTSDHVNQVVNIVAENKSGSYKLAVLDGQELGWIDHRALGRIDATTVARIGRGSYSIDTQPWGTAGFQTIGRSDDLLGQQVKVVEQTQNKYYSYVIVNDQPYGWVDNRSLIGNEESYDTWIINPNYRIDNAPWGERGFQQREMSTDYVNQRVSVLGINASKTYYLISNQNGKTLGWVDHRALSNVNYQAQIIRGDNYSIDSRPWTDRTGHRLGMAKDYLYQNVQVISVTPNKFYLMVLMDNQPLGWIDYRALSREHGLSVQIRGGRYSIDSKPWGTSGYQQQTTARNLQGKTVEILGETKNRLYQLIRYNDTNLGWIDRRGIVEIKQIVFIDAGHGGKESGAVYNGVYEKDLNLIIAKKVQKLLEEEGYMVLMTRDGDQFVDVSTARSLLSNNSDADIFVSIHHNAIGSAQGKSVNGIETYYYGNNPSYPPKINQKYHLNQERMSNSKKLANLIHEELLKFTSATNRGVRQASFAVLRETRQPAVLLELGYMTNFQELRNLTTKSYQERLALGIVNGIKRYYV